MAKTITLSKIVASFIQHAAIRRQGQDLAVKELLSQMNDYTVIFDENDDPDNVELVASKVPVKSFMFAYKSIFLYKK